MLPDFNRSERKALLLGTVLVLLGAAARLGLGPGESAWAWRPAASAGDAAAGLREVRRAVERSRERAARIATPLGEDERLDPNRAPEAELQRLSGVGPALAGAIAERRRREPFRWTGDLLSVRGIGPATLERIAPHLDLPDRPPPGGAPGAAGDGGGKVDLNEAGRAELLALPGVGPVLAERILARRRRAPFTRVDELLEVAGIGPVRLEDLRPRVVAR